MTNFVSCLSAPPLVWPLDKTPAELTEPSPLPPALFGLNPGTLDTLHPPAHQRQTPRVLRLPLRLRPATTPWGGLSRCEDL